MDFDIIVIGGGPGGYVAAIKAAQLGKRTALIEKDKIGGTCLNKGCIPTKALLKSIETMKDVKRALQFGVLGVKPESISLDMKAVQKRKEGIRSQLVEGVGKILEVNGVTVLMGDAAIVDSHTVLLGEKAYTADYFIIATGSSPKSLEIPIHPEMKVYTSSDILEITDIPESIAVIGGGVIGIELAYFLANAGSKVTVIEFLDRILPMVDEEITYYAADMMMDIGVDIHTGARVKEIKKDFVVFEKDEAEHKLMVSEVLMAVGRKPDIESIPCRQLGIRTEKGAILTDDTLKTTLDNVYAIGDVNGKAMLAHVASMEGIIAVKNICGQTCKMDYGKVPSAVYLQPEIACVGMTEEEAKNKYKDVKVGRFPLSANGKAKVDGEEKGMIKVITEGRYGEILGVHMYCIHATDMIAESTAAMKLECTREELSMVIHPHPTVSEALAEAFYAVNGRAIHNV